MNDFNFTTEVVALKPDEVIDFFVLLTCNFKIPFSLSSAHFKCPWITFDFYFLIVLLLPIFEFVWALIYTYLFSLQFPAFFLLPISCLTDILWLECSCADYISFDDLLKNKFFISENGNMMW